MAADIYELIDELRKDMDAAGDTPLGRLLMGVLLIHERLEEIEARHKDEDQRAMEL